MILMSPTTSMISPRRMCQRGDSGIIRMPSHSAIAGIEQTSSIQRQACPLPSATVTPPRAARVSQETISPASYVPEGSFATSAVGPPWIEAITARSEEHTSELQSRGHLVCRLLLEKKKKKKKI